MFKTNKDFYYAELHKYLHIHSLVVPRTIILNRLLLPNLLVDVSDVSRHVVICRELGLADGTLIVFLALKSNTIVSASLEKEGTEILAVCVRICFVSFDFV